MSWFGGFVGGLLAGYATIRIKSWPVMAVLAAATPALAVGQLLGRIGCFLVGDDYGSPTTLPVGRGLSARPAADARARASRRRSTKRSSWPCLTWVLIRVAAAGRGRSRGPRPLSGRAGAFRFVLEFVRVNTRVAGPLTVAHFFALAVVVLGVGFFGYR